MLQKLSADTNAVNWFDIPVTDLPRAKMFYDTIFDIDMEIGGSETEQMAFFPSQERHDYGFVRRALRIFANEERFYTWPGWTADLFKCEPQT